MAAEHLAARGVSVDILDAMPSPGRKFLMAGRGGLNISNNEPMPLFVSRFGEAAQWLGPALDDMGPEEVRQWMEGLGIRCHTGRSGRMFPSTMKAAPLLRVWLQRLVSHGVRFHLRHRWMGWDEAGDLVFQTPAGEMIWKADHTLLALGGGSWSRLGSRGDWVNILRSRGVDVASLVPANCGVELEWSAHLASHYAGHPIKPVTVMLQDPSGQRLQSRGELILTRNGLEGGCLYALIPLIRSVLAEAANARVWLDLIPDRTVAMVEEKLADEWGKSSTSDVLRRRLGISGVKAALLHEAGAIPRDRAEVLARRLKSLPLEVSSLRPLDEAISTAGGIAKSAIDEHYRLIAMPQVSVAGEMLDWEAPTGGYLLTACLATGKAAALGILKTLNGSSV